MDSDLAVAPTALYIGPFHLSSGARRRMRPDGVKPPLETTVLWMEERPETMESHLAGINTTLSNHMTEYQAAFRILDVRIQGLVWAVGVLAGLVFLIVGAPLSIAVRAAFLVPGG